MRSRVVHARALRLTLAAVVSAVLAAHAQVPAPPARIDVSKLGPQVGDPVPDFRLTDQRGTTQTLSSIMGPRGAVLVFVRSADW